MKEETRRFGILVSILTMATLCLLLHYYPPHQLHLPPCIFHEITGLYCPGCGSARALHHLMRFEILDALHCNLFFVLFFPLFIYFMARVIAETFGWGKLPELRATPAMTRVLALSILLWWIVRNLPFEIFRIPG